MLTLKEIILVKLAAGFVDDSNRREIFDFEEIWSEVIRKEMSAFCIPFTLQDDIIALIKHMLREIYKWIMDHAGFFIEDIEESFKFYFNADGTVDRVKTADFVINSEELDEETRFVLACQYWSSWDVLALFKNLQESEREQILQKYSRANEDLNFYGNNVVQWVEDYNEGRIIESRSLCYQSYDWNYASLQSRLFG
ncbi:hypothetical protein TNCV_2984021 [Trichonephila clavipes]|nr:hypothetical protein TNCV_2984021 [Trichonephila clavipes]